MATQLDPLIEWVVTELRQAGAEGLAISSVFERLEGEYAGLDDHTKNHVWKDLISREDVILVDSQKALKNSGLRKLSLDDIHELEMAERKISVKGGAAEAETKKDRALIQQRQVQRPNVSQSNILTTSTSSKGTYPSHVFDPKQSTQQSQVQGPNASPSSILAASTSSPNSSLNGHDLNVSHLNNSESNDPPLNISPSNGIDPHVSTANRKASASTKQGQLDGHGSIIPIPNPSTPNTASVNASSPNGSEQQLSATKRTSSEVPLIDPPAKRRRRPPQSTHTPSKTTPEAASAPTTMEPPQLQSTPKKRGRPQGRKSEVRALGLPSTPTSSTDLNDMQTATPTNMSPTSSGRTSNRKRKQTTKFVEELTKKSKCQNAAAISPEATDQTTSAERPAKKPRLQHSTVEPLEATDRAPSNQETVPSASSPEPLVSSTIPSNPPNDQPPEISELAEPLHEKNILPPLVELPPKDVAVSNAASAITSTPITPVPQAIPSSGGLNPIILANLQARQTSPSVLSHQTLLAQMFSQPTRSSSYSSPYGPSALSSSAPPSQPILPPVPVSSIQPLAVPTPIHPPVSARAIYSQGSRQQPPSLNAEGQLQAQGQKPHPGDLHGSREQPHASNPYAPGLGYNPAKPTTILHPSHYTPQTHPQFVNPQLVGMMSSLFDPPPPPPSAHTPPPAGSLQTDLVHANGLSPRHPGAPSGFFSQPPLPIPKAQSKPNKRKFSGEDAQPDMTQPKPAKRMHLPRPNNSDGRSLEDQLADAEAVVFPEGVRKLACKYNGYCGNLVLSEDMSALEFHVAVVPAPATPMLFLPMSQIPQNPKLSARGSNPMELRLTAKDELELDILHRFAWANNASGREASRKMFVDIAAAIANHQYEAGGDFRNHDDVKREIEKPYVCPKCGDRFKNDNGLEYHLTKARKSACNPNADPEMVAAQKERAKTVKNSKGEKEPASKNSSAQRQAPPLGEPQEPQEQVTPKRAKAKAMRAAPKPKRSVERQVGEVADDSDDSLDSVEEFFLHHNTTGVERPRLAAFAAEPRASPKKKVYKALPFEANVLKEIAKEVAASEDDLAEDAWMGPPEQSQSSEQLNEQRCEEIILSLVKDNDHIFPGDRSIWMAVVGVCLKENPIPNLPGTKICSQTIDSLVEKNKLKLVEFTFADEKKREHTRTILTTNGYRMSAKESEMMRNLIKTHHPKFYVPTQFVPADSVLEKLMALATRSLTNKERFRKEVSPDVESEPDERSPLVINDDSSDDEFIGDGVDENDDAADLPLDDEEDEPATEAEELEEPEKKKGPKRKRGPKGVKHERRRNPEHNKAIAEGVRRSWQKIKAQGIKPFPNRKPAKKPRARNFWSQEEKDRRAAMRVPLTQEQKDQRAANAALRLQTWNNSPAFMPNPQTGAWDQLPPPPPKPSRRGGTRKDRHFFVEPITYLQAPNGAWSVRAFGHGVKPIHARPSRRADGNPNFHNYQKRLEEGYRPVAFPAVHKRLNLPAMPSKVLLGTHSNTYVVDGVQFNKKTGKPIRKRAKPAKGASASPESEDIRTSKAASAVVRANDNNFPRFVPPTQGELWSTRTPRKQLDEVSIVNLVEPGKLGPKSRRNPGLQFLPPSYGLDPSMYEGGDPAKFGYSSRYEYIQFVDPQIVTEEDDPAKGSGSWTVGAFHASVSPKFSVQWNDATAFDVETLPFDQLEVIPEPLGKTPRKNISHAPKKRKLIGNWPGLNSESVPPAEVYSFSRNLTALPHDFEGVLENPMDAPKKFGVELGKPNQATVEGRRIKGPRAWMEPKMERRFILFVVVVRTLTGGLDGRIDWVIIAHYFQEFSCNFLKTYWAKLHPVKKDVIEQLVTDFQEAFPAAYEAKQIPRIDFEHLVDYKWNALVNWVSKNLDSTLIARDIELPASRAEFDEEGHEELDRDPKRWRESFFKLGTNTPNYQRFDEACAVANTDMPQRGQLKPDNPEYRVARSWLRATALTPQQLLDENVKLAETKLKKLGQETVDIVLANLRDEKVLVKFSRKKLLLGRRYECMDTFFAPLRRAVKDPVFVQAVEFKRYMDAEFRAGKPSIRPDYFVTEGAVMVITSMVAAGRLQLLPSNEPMQKMGLVPDGGYETKTIPRERLIFDLDVYPTDTYVYDDENPVLKAYLSSQPPRPDAEGDGLNAGALPLWFGIHDELLPELWKKVLVGVGQISAFRAGANIQSLRRVFKPCLEMWELELLMKWGTEVGIFQECVPGIEGWMAGEWWWLLIGRTCEIYKPVGEVDIKVVARGTTAKAPKVVRGKTPVNKSLERVRKVDNLNGGA